MKQNKTTCFWFSTLSILIAVGYRNPEEIMTVMVPEARGEGLIVGKQLFSDHSGKATGSQPIVASPRTTGH